MDHLRSRSDTFIPDVDLDLFHIDARAHDIAQPELFVMNNFQPSHATTTLDRLLQVRSSGRHQGRIYEPCPEFQLETLARAANIMYDVDREVASILAANSTMFGDALSYRKYVHERCTIVSSYLCSQSITPLSWNFTFI